MSLPISATVTAAVGSSSPTSRKAILAAGLCLAAGAACAQGASEADLAQRLDRLAAELADVKAQLAQLRQQQGGAVAATAPAGAAAAAPVAAAAAAPLPGATAMAPATGYGLREPATVLSSYGEINYSRPLRAAENASADLRRLVFGFQHRFDPKTRVVTEIEIEHAVSSAGDPGEVAVEQAFIEHQFHPQWAARAGLFLMPAGLINENHEPTAYYGVRRNFVETAIIPTTWREGGVQLVGALDSGLTLQGGLSTGFDLNKWDAASPDGAESPLGATHQELAIAKARNLALFGAVNWRGTPGLLIGGSLFSGGATHGQAVSDARVTLWDVHARWTPGRWDLAALYSRGTISGTAELNTRLVGQPTLIPKSFDGWYGQAAYRLWSNADYALVPFARYEQFNTGRGYADIGAGLTPDGRPTERVATVGASFYVGAGVVLKADLQRFRMARDADRVNLGLGWSF